MKTIVLFMACFCGLGLVRDYQMQGFSLGNLDNIFLEQGGKLPARQRPITPMSLYPHLMATRGTANYSRSKIVGGQEAADHEFPFMVPLLIQDLYFCTGTILCKQLV